MKSRFLLSWALAGLFASDVSVRADTFVTISPTASSAATVTPRWAIASQQSGLGYIDGNSGFGGATATNFFTITGATIGLGGSSTGFTSYLPVGTATPESSVGDALTPTSYAALTYVAANLGLIGPLSFYSIHHAATGDYLALIQPAVPTVSDQKPMSVPGGPGTAGATGYFALSFAADNPGGWGAELFYYFRTNALGETVFGSLIPALASGPTDRWNLGANRGFTDLAYTSTDLGFGFGASQFYYLRLDPVTQTTFFGWLNPATGVATDIQNLGAIFHTLTFTPTDVGYGPDNFYSIGQALQAQTITFGALANHTACDAPFTVVLPVSSSGLPVSVAVTGPATLAGNVITLTGALGTVSLTASQAGSGTFAAALPVMQSFTVAACVVAPLTPQTITFGPLPNHTACDAPFSFIFPVSTSGLAVSLTVTGPATLSSGNLITLTGAAGTVTLTASQVGNATFAAAVPVTESFVVTACVVAPVTPLTPQTITFGPLPNHTACDAPFSFVFPVSTSGLPVSLTITGPATISGGNLITLTGAAGTVSLTATQVGNGTFAAAVPVTESFTVAACVVAPPPGVIPVVTSLQDIQSYVLNNQTGVGIGANQVGGTVGVPFTYQITATGTPTAYGATLIPAGLSFNSVTGVISGTPTIANTWFTTVTASNATGTGSALVIIVIAPAGVAPVITSQHVIQPDPINNPAGVGVGANAVEGTIGVPLTYQITATGSPSGYGATLLPAGLTLNASTGVISGTPTTANTWFTAVQALNAVGSGTATVIFVIAPLASSRIINLSALSSVGAGNPALVMGFIVAGTGKSVLLRGVGPGLAAFGVPNVVPDPLLSLFGAGGGLIAADAQWQVPSAGQSSGALIAAAGAQLGAFALPNGSADSALLLTLNAGVYSTSVVSQSGRTGTALMEIYDADLLPGGRLINVSIRTTLSTAGGLVTAGLVVAGNAPKTLLIRADGPALASFGVAGALPDPQLAILTGSATIAPTATWAGGGAGAGLITTAAAQVGAFPFAPGSSDAAMLVTLQPGVYTVWVTSAHNLTGAVLIEVYDTQ